MANKKKRKQEKILNTTPLIEREIKIVNFAEMVSSICCPFIIVAILE